jgi:hypothetical protein
MTQVDTLLGGPLTDLEKFALSFPVPALDLPALHDGSDEAYVQRAIELSYDLIRADESESGLVATLQKFGAIP